MTFTPASEKQLYWITKLVDEKAISDGMRENIKAGLELGNISKTEAGKFLDVLFDKNIPNVPVAGAITEVGFYRHEDKVYQVKKAKSTGNLYAQLVTAHGFNYELGKGMMKTLKADMKMTVDEIRAYGCETGICANCAALLSDPISIFIGLGTQCGPNLMGKEAYSEAKKAAKADPGTAEAITAKEAAKVTVAQEVIAPVLKTNGPCDECGRKSKFGPLTPAVDSSGIGGMVCSSCAKMASYELSFA